DLDAAPAGAGRFPHDHQDALHRDLPHQPSPARRRPSPAGRRTSRTGRRRLRRGPRRTVGARPGVGRGRLPGSGHHGRRGVSGIAPHRSGAGPFTTCGRRSRRGDDVVIDMPTSIFAAWGRLEQLRRRTTRAGAPWWMHNVSERLGALIVLGLRGTSISPNTVTVFGLALYLPTAWYLGTRSSVGISGVIALMLWWQLAFSMDCADGMLARERGQASAFGAWLDQLVDFASHFLVFGSLRAVLVRAFALLAHRAGTPGA